MSSYTYSKAQVEMYAMRKASVVCTYYLDRVRPDSLILDVGCGPGSISLDLTSYVPQGKVTGLDQSSMAINAAEQAAAQRNVPKSQAEFHLGSALDIPFPDNSFDVVTCHQVLVHLPGTGPTDALREMRRVCKPGGFVAAREAEWSGWTVYPRFAGVISSIDLFEEIRAVKGTTANFARGREFARLAGFSRDEIEISMGVLSYGDRARTEIWGELMAKRLEDSDLSKTALEHGLRTEMQLKEMAAGWREWAVHEDAFFSVTDAQIICTKH